eukprot:COSAG06_NODE_25513_length_635_cov_0.686567_2_plen_83_part_00
MLELARSDPFAGNYPHGTLWKLADCSSQAFSAFLGLNQHQHLHLLLLLRLCLRLHLYQRSFPFFGTATFPASASTIRNPCQR